NEVARLYELQDELLLFLAGVAGNVNDAAGIVVVDQSPATEHVIQHAEDGFFIAGDDARGEDDRIVFVHRDAAVIVDGDSRERRHWLGLRTTGENDQALGIEAPDILRADDHAVGNAEAIERMRDLHVVDHAAADEGDFAAHAAGDVDDLLD